VDIVEVFLNLALMGSAWVLWVLVALSVLSIAVIIERYWFYNRLKIDFSDFNNRLSTLLIDQKYKEAEDYCRAQTAVEAQVAAKGLFYRDRGARIAEESMSSYLISERQHLDRGLVILGTLGNNAPFIGLFGTVLGIIEAFHSLKMNPAGGPSVVMSGISEALVATAVGLIVAIPAVIAYNLFSRLVKRRIANSESVMKLVTSQMTQS
jgi:biopolymer transport protein ExbB/TolQ